MRALLSFNADSYIYIASNFPIWFDCAMILVNVYVLVGLIPWLIVSAYGVCNDQGIFSSRIHKSSMVIMNSSPQSTNLESCCRTGYASVISATMATFTDSQRVYELDGYVEDSTDYCGRSQPHYRGSCANATEKP